LRTFLSKDFYLCAFLIARGFELQDYQRKSGLTEFTFEEDKTLKELVTKFYSFQTTIEPVGYGQAIRNLKGAIHSLSTSNNRVNNNERKI